MANFFSAVRLNQPIVIEHDPTATVRFHFGLQVTQIFRDGTFKVQTAPQHTAFRIYSRGGQELGRNQGWSRVHTDLQAVIESLTARQCHTSLRSLLFQLGSSLHLTQNSASATELMAVAQERLEVAQLALEMAKRLQHAEEIEGAEG